MSITEFIWILQTKLRNAEFVTIANKITCYTFHIKEQYSIYIFLTANKIMIKFILQLLHMLSWALIIVCIVATVGLPKM